MPPEKNVYPQKTKSWLCPWFEITNVAVRLCFNAPTINILVTYGALQVLYCIVLYCAWWHQISKPDAEFWRRHIPWVCVWRWTVWVWTGRPPCDYHVLRFLWPRDVGEPRLLSAAWWRPEPEVWLSSPNTTNMIKPWFHVQLNKINAAIK